MIRTILEFAFETDDADCRYWQEWVIVENNRGVNYDEIKEYIDSTMNDYNFIDKDYSYIVELIMNGTTLYWEFMGNDVPESNTIYTFWI